MSNLQNETITLHTAHNPQQTAGTRTVPIYQSTAYEFKDTQHAARLFELKEFGYIYTRLNNPTNDILEQRLAAIEKGIGAVSFASGTSALSTTLLTLLKPGDHIVASNSLYGGTYNLLNVTLRRLGIETTFVNPDDVSNFEKAIGNNTKIIYFETLGNPKLDVLDLEEIANIAQRHHLLTIADNTVPTPALLNPIAYGINIVIHSLTKYISGHGSSLGGVVIDGGNFDWTNGTFPEFTEPSKGYHGLEYAHTFGALAFLVKLRVEGLRDFGAALSPLNAFQIIQGLETLNIRLQQHSKNALALAKWLARLDEIAWVNYPGLTENQTQNLTQKYLPDGQSGIVTFGLKGGFEAAEIFANNTEIISLIANFGETKTLLSHPASTTHQQLTEAEQETTGVTPDLIRLSVGLENIEDLKKDILQALQKVENHATILEH